MYTIGQVAEMFHLPISTLRYYDKEGLFPGLERKAGIRRFTEQELEALRVIECLKKAGLEIRDIRQMTRMQRTLDMIRYKCWYYETAMKEGGEERLKALSPSEMPQDVRRAYEGAHRP